MPIPFRPGSFVLGALTLGAVLALTGARVAGTERSLLVQLEPQPKDHVRITGDVPYQVPLGKVLTLEAFGCDGTPVSWNQLIRIEADGQAIGMLETYSNQEPRDIPFGITVGEGSTVSLVEVNSQGPAKVVVYGYLSDARTADDDEGSLRVQLEPQPKDHVRVYEGVPYQVPRGKLLTLRAYAPDGSWPDTKKTVRVEVDGQPTGRLDINKFMIYGIDVWEIPFGITAVEGSTVSLVEVSTPSVPPSSRIVAYGYLSDA